MNKRQFYKIQADAFRDYAAKFPDKEDLLSLFDEWADSKDIFGVDKQSIWKLVRNFRPKKSLVIEEGGDAFLRLSEVLDILYQGDMKYLEKRMQEGKKKKAQE